MTWSANISGHIADREEEQRIGERLRQVARELGATSFTFAGNKYRINGLDAEVEKVSE